MKQILKIGYCPRCDGCLDYSKDEMDYDLKVMRDPCYCHSGKPLGKCHPEYHFPPCSMCECEGEVQD